MIVPWDAGGDTDAIYRIIAEEMEAIIGQNIVIKNIAGGSGVIGSQEALNAQNDGYTLLAVHESMPMSELTGQATFGYADFEPVSLMTSTHKAVATNPGSSWKTMEDVIGDAKKNPGKFAFAASIGSISQLEPALIETNTDTTFNIVGFDGTAERMKAIAAGDVDLTTVSVTAGKDYLADGKLKLLGYTGEERSEVLPDVPTLQEQGIDVVSATNRGIVVPKDTPEAIIKVLDNALEQVADRDDFKQKMDDLGTDVNYKNAKDYQQFLDEEQEDMEKALENSGLLE